LNVVAALCALRTNRTLARDEVDRLCGRSQSEKCSRLRDEKSPRRGLDWRPLASRHLSVPHLRVRRRPKDPLGHPVVGQIQQFFSNLQIVRQSGKPNAFARIG
jgi:hypothetical protein